MDETNASQLFATSDPSVGGSVIGYRGPFALLYVRATGRLTRVSREITVGRATESEVRDQLPARNDSSTSSAQYVMLDGVGKTVFF